MNIDELFEELTKFNIVPTAKDLCQIMGMTEENFSRAKKAKRQIKYKNVEKIEQHYGIEMSIKNQVNFVIISPEEAENIIVKIKPGQTVKVEVI